MKIQTHYILNPVFILSLIILLLNDHIWKYTYGNWLTGKLSDVFGLIVLVLYLQVFIPIRYKKQLYSFVVIAFTVWKSPLSQSFIEGWNALFTSFQLQRVIDFTDLYCLLILIPIYHYQAHSYSFRIPKKVLFYPLFGLGLFAIVATSRAKTYPFYDETIFINKVVKVNLTREQFFKKLTQDNIHFSQDSTINFDKKTWDKYVLDSVVIGEQTISSIVIGVREKKHKMDVYIQEMHLKEGIEKQSVDYKKIRKLIKKYRVEITGYFHKFR